MSVKSAVVQVLQEASEPLHASEITKRILAKGLWKTKGKTPEATVSAQLSSDIKKRGDDSDFLRVAPQTFAMRDKASVSALPESTSPPSPPQRKSKAYSFTDAAEKILEQFSDKHPMHYRAVTDKALELGWLSTEGKTPEATMYAQILTEIKRRQKRGEQPRFVQHGGGYVSLSRWMGKGLTFDIEQHNKQVRKALHKRLLSMDPTEFEELVARLLAEIGFEDIEVTRHSSDGGIDVRGTLVVGDVIRTKMAVQVKRWKRNVQAPIVQQVRGSLGTHEQGLVITTSKFSAGAQREAARPDAVPVALMNGEEMVALLAAYEIGVSRNSVDILDVKEDD